MTRDVRITLVSYFDIAARWFVIGYVGGIATGIVAVYFLFGGSK